MSCGNLLSSFCRLSQIKLGKKKKLGRGIGKKLKEKKLRPQLQIEMKNRLKYSRIVHILTPFCNPAKFVESETETLYHEDIRH